jgi:hypothetical protein
LSRIPLISNGNKVYFYADEFVCRCGQCRYSDPEIIPYIISPVLREHLFQVRQSMDIPIIITRGVSCLKQHENIYKKIYGIRWEFFITRNSSHLPDKEKKIYDGKNEMFYGVDSIPLTNDYLKYFAFCCWFRFAGIIWYKKYIIKSKELLDSFIHVDNHFHRHKLFVQKKIYNIF